MASHPPVDERRPGSARRLRVARATLGGVGAAQGTAGRLLLAVAAIALGVALGFAVQLLNHTALTEFAAGLATLSGDADLQVSGSREGFSQALYPAIVRAPYVAAASPVIQIEAALAADATTLTLVGVDALRAAAITPALVGQGADRFDSLRPDVVFLSPAAAASLRLDRGATLVLKSGRADVALRVAGTVPADPGMRLAVMDIAGLQDRFGLDGRLTRIDVRLRPGFDPGAAAAEIARLLTPGVSVASPRSNLQSTVALTRAYRVNLEVLALVALFTGALLVYSTQALSVLRRRVPFAVLRSLGLTRRQLVGLVVGEGALVGLAGALAGLAAGYAIADAATHWFGVDLGAGFFRGRPPAVAMDWMAALLFGAAGVAAAVLGSYAPARAAGRLAPAAALKAGDAPQDIDPRGRQWALAALVAGAAATLLPPVFGLPLAGYGAIALLLLGTLKLLPGFAAAALAAVPAPRVPAAALALAQVRHAPAQSALSLSSIVAAVALMAAMTVMVASFRGSLEGWLAQVLPADMYVRAAGGDTAHLDDDAQQAITGLAGVARVEFLRAGAIMLPSGGPRVALLARDLDPAEAARRLPLTSEQHLPAAGDPPPAWISEAVADRTSWRIGQVVVLPLREQLVAFTVAGVWRDYARQQGAIIVPRADYRRATGDASVTDAALWLAPDASAQDVREALAQRLVADRLDVSTPGELRALSLRIFDRTFAVTHALEAVAVLIGLTGLSSAFGALVLSRRREFGVLRHLGVTRGQVGAMLAVEGSVLALIGVVTGLVLGFAIALILIHVVNRQSFHWSMDLVVPWGTLAALAVTLVGLATLTAWFAGRRAMGDDAVRAVKEDW